MELIDRLNEFSLSDRNKFFLEDLMYNYSDYIDGLKKDDLKVLNSYLTGLKHAEVRSNQNFDERDFLYLEAIENMVKENSSVCAMVKLFRKNKDITPCDVKYLHELIMRGTLTDNGNYDYRSDDNKFVGAINSDGTKRIDYMPILCSDIENSMNQTLDYLNSKNEDPFIVPFITHGIIATMQPFDDGNTRTARLLQHGKIWTNTKDMYDINLRYPALYLSSVYYRYGNQYRELLANLANNKDNDAWNEWLRFNFNLANEQLVGYNRTLERLRKY